MDKRSRVSANGSPAPPWSSSQPRQASRDVGRSPTLVDVDPAADELADVRRVQLFEGGVVLIEPDPVAGKVQDHVGFAIFLEVDGGQLRGIDRVNLTPCAVVQKGPYA